MLHDLRPYPVMKDSGVPWLGQVPEHWDVLPNRAVFQEVNERGHENEQMLSVTIKQGIIKQRFLLESSSKKDSSRQDKSAYKLVRPGDIAYNKMRAWQGALGASTLQGIISPAYVVMRPRDEQKPAYYHYLMRTPSFAKEAERWSYGITSDMWSLRPEHFRLIYTVVPDIAEQATIVRFLDYADRRIRKAIAAKQRLIKLLQEQKQVIIYQAVTRGLDPDVKLKPSGVEWLGDVPEGWSILKIGYFAKVGNGSTPSRGNLLYWMDGTYPWLNSSVVNQGKVTTANQFVTHQALRECHLPIVPPDSVLVAITGQGKTRGTAAVLDIEATINQHIAYITPRPNSDVTAEYIQSFLSAAYSELRRLSDDSGSTKGALTCDDLKSFKIAIPPVFEQAQLLQHIREASASIDLAISQAQSEISLLREYRTRLIADVVTGKLDVRATAVRLPEPEQDALPEELDGGEGEEMETNEDMVEAEGVEA